MQGLKSYILSLKILFLLSLIALCALSIFSYLKNIDLLSKAMLINHTTLVKSEIENNLSLLKDAESGNRGFFITRDSVFLDPYKAALDKIPVSLKKLDSLLKDNSQQLIALIKLKRLTDERLFTLKFLGNSLKVSKNPYEIFRNGKTEMDQIRMHSSLMIHEEERLLNDRTASLNSAVSVAPKIFVLLAGFALLLLSFSYLKILKELKKSNALQNDLVVLNETLEKSNNELAQFAYVASHDLQEPLRKIQTFASRINDNEKSLSDKGKDYFERINKSAKTMQQLILDILSYSRISKLEEEKTIVDLNDIINTAKYPLEHLLFEKKAIIFISKLSSIKVIKYQFEQLFTNIISNALKFAKPMAICQINIDSTILIGDKIEVEGINKFINYHCITIKDNGIGFDSKNGEKIFKIFNRLNVKEEYEGNGIGLAIVKKIMDSHAGFVTASGVKGVGATFTLYLPV